MPNRQDTGLFDLDLSHDDYPFPTDRGRQRPQHFKSSSHDPNRLQRLQVFDQIMGLLVIQTQPEKAVVVLDHIIERCKASVMEETTLRVGPEALEGSGAVALVRRTVGLKIVDSDLFWRVHIPPRLAKQQRNMARCTLRLAFEKLLAASRRVFIEAPLRR